MSARFEIECAFLGSSVNPIVVVVVVFSKLFFSFFKTSYRNHIRECQTVWTHIRPRHSVRPDLGPNCLQKLLAYHISRQTVNYGLYENVELPSRVQCLVDFSENPSITAL